MAKYRIGIVGLGKITEDQHVPVIRKNGHSRSGSIGAAINTPSDARGATLLDANPTAECPMNMH